MKIPSRKQQANIDFCPFMDLLDKKYGFNHRDMAGSHSKEAYAERNALRDEWMDANGYSGKQYVLDRPEGSKKDWAIDSEEMRLRVEINKRVWKEIEYKERPYQDVWHWLLDHDFCEFRRGGYNSLWLDEDRLSDEKIPDYVRIVLKAIYEEVKNHDAYDGESVNFYIDW